MVLILDGNSGIGANVESKLCHLIYLRHLIGVQSRIGFIFLRIDLFFFHVCGTCSALTFDIRAMFSEEYISELIKYKAFPFVLVQKMWIQRNAMDILISSRRMLCAVPLSFELTLCHNFCLPFDIFLT